MVSEKDLKRDAMWFEAVDRLELMEANPKDRWIVLMNRGLDFKVIVDHKAKKVGRGELTKEEYAMIKKIEDEYGIICYYLIEDEGMWPDGCTFKRYSLLYIDENVDDYESEREDSIIWCGTVPVYVVNMEDERCSEFTEMKFENVGGNIVNAS